MQHQSRAYKARLVNRRDSFVFSMGHSHFNLDPAPNDFCRHGGAEPAARWFGGL